MFIYFDPPYYEKGRRLYMNYFSSEDHEKLRNAVSLLDCKWIMTYDDNEKIDELYKNYHRCRFSINYSLANKKRGGELMILKIHLAFRVLETISEMPRSISFDSRSINWEEK